MKNLLFIYFHYKVYHEVLTIQIIFEIIKNWYKTIRIQILNKRMENLLEKIKNG